MTSGNPKTLRDLEVEICANHQKVNLDRIVLWKTNGLMLRYVA
jgi:hypothetical protein